MKELSGTDPSELHYSSICYNAAHANNVVFCFVLTLFLIHAYNITLFPFLGWDVMVRYVSIYLYKYDF